MSNEVDPESVQKKESGFLKGSLHDVRKSQILLVQITVVSVVVRSFHRQKANKPKLVKQCSRQGGKIKTWRAEMFLKLNHLSPIFHYVVNVIGCGQSGKFKA